MNCSICADEQRIRILGSKNSQDLPECGPCYSQKLANTRSGALLFAVTCYLMLAITHYLFAHILVKMDLNQSKFSIIILCAVVRSVCYLLF